MVCGMHTLVYSTLPNTPNPTHPFIPVLLLPSSPHFTQTLKAWRGEGPLKAVEVILKSSLKGESLRWGGGGWILNRTEKSGEKGFWWVGWGGSILPMQPGQGAGLWEEWRGGEGLDMAISIWKVKACIDELNWALWPPPPHTHKNHVLCCRLKGCHSNTASSNRFLIPFLTQLQRRYLCGWSQLVSVWVCARFCWPRLQNQ